MGGMVVGPRFGWGWNQHEQINQILSEALPKGSPFRQFLKEHHKAIAKACEEEDRFLSNNKRPHFIHLDDIEHNAPPHRKDKKTITLEGVSNQFGPHRRELIEQALAEELPVWEKSLWDSPQNVLGLFQQYKQELTEVMKKTPSDEKAIAEGVGRLLHLVDMAQPFHTTQWYKWPLVLGEHTFDSHRFSELIKLIGNKAKTKLAKGVAERMEALKDKERLKPEFTEMVTRSHLRLFDLWQKYTQVATKATKNKSLFNGRLDNVTEPLEEQWRPVLQQSAVDGIALVGSVLERLFSTYPLNQKKVSKQKYYELRP